MGRIAGKLAAIAFATAALAVGSLAQQSESLGDCARAARKDKKPPATKVFTNENLPSGGPLSVVGPPASSSAAEEDKDADADKEVGKKEGAEKEGSGKKAEGSAAWRDKIAGQNKKIADIAHELDLLQREYKLRITAFYSDAGWQLRDSKKWTEEDAKYRAEIAEKQKQLDEAKAQLQDMQEQARKAGQPSSVSE